MLSDARGARYDSRQGRQKNAKSLLIHCREFMAAERARVATPQPLGDALAVELVPARARHHAHLLAILKVLEADRTLRRRRRRRTSLERLLLQAGHGRGGRRDRTEPFVRFLLLQTCYDGFDVEPQRPCKEMQAHGFVDLPGNHLLGKVVVVVAPSSVQKLICCC